MEDYKNKPFVPYEILAPGYEAVWTGKRLTKDTKLVKEGEVRDEAGNILAEGEFVDDNGDIYFKWSLWSFMLDDSGWDDEVDYINGMQDKLGSLNDDARRIRAQITGLVHCDSGFPVTLDELLTAIGTGKLPCNAFLSGCWLSQGGRTTQPHQYDSMAMIEEILLDYLDSKPSEKLIKKYPHARGFVERTYEWFGPLEEFSDVQQLMVERILLPFEFFTGRKTDYDEVNKKCFLENSEGYKLDEKIATITDLPDINAKWPEEFNKNLAELNDEVKRELYKLCMHIRWGLPGLSDCHHATFRKIEKWIHGIGTGRLEIPTRKEGTERARLRELLFGYAFALDKWLLGIPLQFLLLDLGHIDLGFNPKNEILRVYANLGEERTTVKEWLVACLWHNMCYNTTGGWEFGILNSRHKEFYEKMEKKGVSVHEWMDEMR